MNQEPVVVFDPQDVEKNKVMAVLSAVFLILFFLPLVTDKDSAYGRFYANQSLVLFIFGVVVNIAGYILTIIPFIGWILRAVLGLAMFVLWLLNLIGACKGEGRPLPVLGAIQILK